MGIMLLFVSGVLCAVDVSLLPRSDKSQTFCVVQKGENVVYIQFASHKTPNACLSECLLRKSCLFVERVPTLSSAVRTESHNVLMEQLITTVRGCFSTFLLRWRAYRGAQRRCQSQRTKEMQHSFLKLTPPFSQKL